jgi:hypothetical protein
MTQIVHASLWVSIGHDSAESRDKVLKSRGATILLHSHAALTAHRSAHLPENDRSAFAMRRLCRNEHGDLPILFRQRRLMGADGKAE